MKPSPSFGQFSEKGIGIKEWIWGEEPVFMPKSFSRFSRPKDNFVQRINDCTFKLSFRFLTPLLLQHLALKTLFLSNNQNEASPKLASFLEPPYYLKASYQQIDA